MSFSNGSWLRCAAATRAVDVDDRRRKMVDSEKLYNAQFPASDVALESQGHSVQEHSVIKSHLRRRRGTVRKYSRLAELVISSLMAGRGRRDQQVRQRAIASTGRIDEAYI